jgi:predicted nicotinamide N-methyase
MSELEELMERIKSKYTVEIIPVKVGDKVLKTLQIKDFEEYLAELVEKGEVGVLDLPYWAKIWDAGMLLAYFMGRQPVVLGQHILEIGAGVGIVGVYAALHGHRVTISDINEDALMFARANALLNGVPQVDVRRLDWNRAELPRTYDVIIGAEVVYDRESYPAMVQFLRKGIRPGGIIFMAKNAQLNAPKFFAEMSRYFEFKYTTQTISTDGEPQRIELYAIRLKNKAVHDRTHPA